MSRSKDIGTRAETALVRAARRFGFGNAERRALAGSADVGDVLLCPGVIVEVKAGEQTRNSSDAQVADWMDETNRERLAARADVGMLVLKRHGKGDPLDWWCYLPMGGLVNLTTAPFGRHFDSRHWTFMRVRLSVRSAMILLRAAGWGDPLDDEVTP